MHDLPGLGAEGRLRISRVDGLRVQILRLWRPEASLLTRLAAVLGAELPLRPNTTAGVRPRLLWMAPGEWAVLGAPAGSEDAIATACGGALHHLADVTGGRAILAVEGPAAPDLLAKGCSLDFHPRAFAPGTCAQSLLAQVRVLVERPGEALRFNLILDRSLLGHLEAWLQFATAEFEVQGESPEP
jgi:sarcosine oxidase, subunit gamma